MTTKRLLVATVIVAAPLAIVFGQPLFPTQPKVDPYETQYLEPSGPRLKVEPRPTPAPTPASKFRFSPSTRASEQVDEAVTIERPGRAPRAISKPTPAVEPVRPMPEVKQKPAPRPRVAPPPPPKVERIEEDVTPPPSRTNAPGTPEQSLAVSEDTEGGFRFERIPVRITIDLREGYDSNVYTTATNPEGSWFTNIGGRAFYEFGTARTRGSFDLSGGYTAYYDRSGDPDDFDVRYTGQITHRASPRLTLRSNTYVAYESEPDYGLVGGANRRSGDYFYSASEFGAAYLWTRRFSTDTSYKLTSLFYQEDRFARSEDRFEHLFSQAFRFLVLPTTVAVMEYRFQYVQYTKQSFRDSYSNFILVGADHSFSARLSGTFRTGVEFRENDTGANQTKPYFEGTLRYAVGDRTSIEMRSRYGLEQSDVATDQDRETFRIGLAGSHAITERISTWVTFDYNHSTYEGVNSFDEDTFDLGVGVRYAMNRTFSVEVAYLFTNVTSGDLFREYERNRAFISTRFAF